MFKPIVCSFIFCLSSWICLQIVGPKILPRECPPPYTVANCNLVGYLIPLNHAIDYFPFLCFCTGFTSVILFTIISLMDGFCLLFVFVVMMEGFDFDLLGTLEGVSFHGCWLIDKCLSLERGGDWTRSFVCLLSTSTTCWSQDNLRVPGLLFASVLKLETYEEVQVCALNAEPTHGWFNPPPDTTLPRPVLLLPPIFA